MKPLLLLAFLLAAAGCDAPTDPPSAISPADEAAYRADATELAFRDQLASADSAQVALSSERAEVFYQVLARVRASNEGDRIAGIHAFPRYVLRDLILSPTESAAWPAAWVRGETVTGYEPVDALVRWYGLTLDSYAHGTALLRAEAPLNPVALANRFGGIPSLRYASPNGIAGDGDDIRVTRAGSVLTLAFSRGSGDCPAGCTARTTWTFRVSGNRVEYLGER